ncbi:MAG: sulfotransferase [Pseudomonadota bacterium]|nr:sulfotransferase [Pseudomonadota bacterium]
MKPERYRQRFGEQVRDGALAAAAATLDSWLARAPQAFEPRLHRIQLNLLSGAYQRAHDAAGGLMSQSDCPPELALETTGCLKAFALHDTLVAWAQRYPWRHKIRAQDLAHIAVNLSAVNAHQLALEWADSGVAKAPTDPVCLVNRALILTYLGQFDRARADLCQVIAGSPHSAMAYWILARLDRQTEDSNHVAAIRQALAAPELAASERAFLGYALFKELDDLGDHAGAWASLQTGSKAARVGRPYSRATQELLFAAIKRAFDAGIANNAVGGDEDPVPIFILGMHRSGTSLIERMLGADPEVCDLGETERFSVALQYAADLHCEQTPDVSLVARSARIDYGLVRKVFNESARMQTQGRRFVTEKTPGNFLNIGFIAQTFPHAKILHLRRDPLDLCFANYREHFGAQVTHTYALEDLIHFHGLYRDLMRHWHDRYPGFILDIDYEQLVREPEAESRRVFDFCGLRWQASVVDVTRRVADPVSTLSSVQVRQAINTASIGRWRPYAQWLGALTEAFPAG